MRGSGAEQRLLPGCSGAVALRAVCPAQITAGVPDYAVGPQVAEKPVVPVGRDLGHRARQSRVAAGGRRVLGSARRLEVLDLSKTTVDRIWPETRLFILTNNSVFIYHIHIHVKPHLSRARQAAAGA